VPADEIHLSETPTKVLIQQTAFLGDLILTLPLIQAARDVWPEAEIWALTIPGTAEILEGHPAVSGSLVYDKRGGESGLPGLLRKARRLRQMSFDLALVPHRSLRSALLCRIAGIPRRVGFRAGAAALLFTQVVSHRRDVHEIERNLDLLRILNLNFTSSAPKIFPGQVQRQQAGDFLNRHGVRSDQDLVGVAPGSVWPTKRWSPDGFARVIQTLRKSRGVSAVLLGGAEDEGLCRQIAQLSGGDVPVAAGRLSPLAAAAVMEQCRVVVSNDSAAAHLAAAVSRPVVVIFGPTVPKFGFAPYGDEHLIVQIDVECRPCGIHGGRRCPRQHFNCMGEITPEKVLRAIHTVLDRSEGEES